LISESTLTLLLDTLSSRSPLQPVNKAVSSSPSPTLNTTRKPYIKSENVYASSCAQRDTEHVPAVSDPTNPHSSGSTTSFQTPQPSRVRVKDEPQLENFPGMSSQTPHSSTPSSVMMSVKADDHRGDIPTTEDGEPFANKQSHGDRIQKMMTEGTPEMLEAEVRNMKLFLEVVRRPMISMLSEQRDAKHWVQQIGKF